jgi:hypothetical protein
MGSLFKFLTARVRRSPTRTSYHMGVPPGRCVLQVDSTQLDLLGAVVEPSVRALNVRDVVERLDFCARRRESS